MHNQQTVAPLVMPASSRHGSQRPPLNKGAGFLRGNKRTDVVGTAAAWRGASGTSLQQAVAARTPWVPTGCTREDSLRHATVGKQGAHGYSSLMMGSIFEFGWHACAQAYLLALMSTVLSPAEAEPGCPPRRDAPHPMRTATAASRTAGVDLQLTASQVVCDGWRRPAAPV